MAASSNADAAICFRCDRPRPNNGFTVENEKTGVVQPVCEICFHLTNLIYKSSRLAVRSEEPVAKVLKNACRIIDVYYSRDNADATVYKRRKIDMDTPLEYLD